MPLLAHLAELRNRFMISILAIGVASVACFIFYDPIYRILSHPFDKIPGFNGKDLFVTSVMEGFLVKFKISIFAGLVFSFPVHIFNIVRFVFPGLLPKEKKVVVYTLLASTVLILSSVYYTYAFVLPFSVKYLMSSDFLPSNVGILLHYGENVFYVFQFLFFGMILFQLPIVLEILLMLNILKRKPLLSAGRYVIVGIFIFAAIVTPPDWVSQCAMAIPLVILYYLTLLVAKIFKFGE
jgi:sec-independent protein translocase protein TatC